MLIFLSPSITLTGFFTTRYLRALELALVPACVIASTKLSALPSMMGTSGPLMSTWALSMPQPYRAAIRCSMVETAAWPLPMVVESRVLTTLAAVASMEIAGERSTRWKTMPVPASAGRRVRVISFPVCSPMPLKLALFPKVCWNIMACSSPK